MLSAHATIEVPSETVCKVRSDPWYRDLMDNAYDMIQCVDPRGRFVYVNRAWQDTLGYSDAELSGLCVWDIIDPSHHQACQKHFAALMERGGSLSNVETIFLTKTQERVFVEGCVTVRVVGHDPQHTRGIFRNVTARKRMEQERERLIADLRDASARAHQLERLVTVCAWTGQIFHKGRWMRVDEYLTSQFGVRISHGMSQEAMDQVLAELQTPPDRPDLQLPT